jgi:hypothetical protein
MNRVFCSSLLAFLLAAPDVLAQTNDGNLLGTVSDATGAAVPGAGVELENTATGVKASAKTDAAGLYRFNNVLIGNYTVTVSATGFTTASLRNVSIELNKNTTANVTLQVGSVSSTVEVSEAATLIDTTTAQVANNYEGRLAFELPSAANPFGGVLNLSLLGAGVTSPGGFGTAQGPSVGGQRPRNNNYTVEGTDNNRKDVTGAVVNVPNDAVAEFTVLQNQFSAEFGHSSGGQFNTVIRGGTNEMHGSVYEYLENRDLNALDQSFKRQGILTKQRYDQNRLGGSVGGPILKNKLFYYGLFQYNPIGQSSTPSSATYAPTADGYQTLAAMAGANTISATNLGILQKYLPAAPVASGKTTPVNGVNIPIGILPIIAPNFSNEYDWLVSVDYSISPRDQLRGRYVDNNVSQIDTNANLAIFFATRPTLTKLLSVSEFHTFSPSVTNEFRLAYNRYNDTIPVTDAQFPGLDVFPNIQIQNDLNAQIGPDTNAPQSTVQNTYQLVENLSWTKGRHDLKFGFDGRDLISVSTFIQRVRGDYDYSTMGRFLLDYVPDLLAQRNVGGKPYAGNNMAYYWFANDNWKMSRSLTVNLGVRYEFNGVPKSMKEFDLNKVADVPGVLTFRAPQPQYHNFAPRVGFAYSPGSNANTVFRGGFGMAYDQVFDNVGTNARPPQATATFDSPVSDTSGYLKGGAISPNTLPASLTPAQARAATSSWLGDQKQGYAINWSFGAQHIFGKDYTVEVRYVGNRGVHLLFQDQLNRASIVTPTHFLPTYLQVPSQAALDSLQLSQAQMVTERNTPGIGNTMAQYGFLGNITAYLPIGNSTYHGLAVDVNKRFSNHLLFKAGYTWSHVIDDSSAEVNSTTLTPRRPQDFLHLRPERATSLLDRRQRLTFTWIYETPWFNGDRNWLKRNVIGNYQVSGTYTVESPEWATPQSAVDSNLNGDAAGDRVILNPGGVPGTSSDVTALRNSAGATVAYLANNPNAQFIKAQSGALATTGRNIFPTRGINNWDANLVKIFSLRERYKFTLRADFLNTFNHPQYTPGRINSITFRNRANVTNYLTPGNALFGQYDQVYSSNPRIIQVSAVVSF